MSRKARKGALALVITLLAAVSGLSINVSPAAAAYSQCPDGWLCFFNGNYGANGDHGVPWFFYFPSNNIQDQGVAARSGYNHNSSFRACGYSATNRVNLNFSAAPGEKKTFSLRIESSWQYASGLCSDA
jgi:hypothetical protein